MGAGLMHPLSRSTGRNAALSYERSAYGHQRSEPLGGRDIGGECIEVAIVHPNERGANVACALQLAFVMDLDQWGELQVKRQGMELTEELVLQRSNNEEHRVSTQRTRLPYLVCIEDEVLAQNGQGNRVVYVA